MLSKSQARSFFLFATVGFSGVFLWLTVDTVRQVPARSHEENMNASVIRGKEIWEKNNCMGCHTILGEGAYYAPELTKAVERRGEAWLRIFLKDPQAMYPGRRKMVQYNFTEEEITDVIGVGTRYDRDGLRAWLDNPQSVKPGTAMPDLNLSASDLDALTDFLMTQR